MKLTDEAGVLTVAETAWKGALPPAAAAALVLVEAWRPGTHDLFDPGLPAVAGAVLLAIWSYFAVVRRHWTFDEPRGTFVARCRHLLHARTTRLPLHALRRVVAEPIGRGDVVLMTLVHSGGTLRFRNGSTSSEAGEVREIVARLQQRFALGPDRFTDMQIIQEVRAQGSEIATIGAIKLLTGRGLKESRDWLKAGMPERDDGG